MSAPNRKLDLRRQARDELHKSRIEKASKGQHVKAFTDLQCCNVINKSIFIKGLRKAGLTVIPQSLSGVDDPNQVAIVVQSQDEASQIVKAFHGSAMEGRAMHISIIKLGKQKGNAYLPKVKYIRQCVSNAFQKTASKKSLAREGPEYAVDTQKARTNINVPGVAIKREEVDDDLVMEKAEEQAMELLDSAGHDFESLGEQIYKQEYAEEPVEMREDSIRPETFATQQMKAGETQKDLRGETCQSQDTARMIVSTRSPTPDDFLSALLAYLNEGTNAGVDKP